MQSRTQDMSGGVFLVTWLATGAVAFAATQLALTISLPQKPILPSVQLPTLSRADSESESIANTAKWPALFGIPVVVKASKPVVEPVVSATYFLKGLVAVDGGGFAILADGPSELMVKPGDVLGDGSVVARIDRHGVVLDLNGQMITVNFADTDQDKNPATPIGAEQTANPVPALPNAIQLDISNLNKSDIRQMLGRAGAVTQVVLPDGTQVLDVLWIRKGQLYDNLGLESGDRILKINGIAAGDNETLLQSMGTLLASDTYHLEIIRNGRRREITVTLVENG